MNVCIACIPICRAIPLHHMHACAHMCGNMRAVITAIIIVGLMQHLHAACTLLAVCSNCRCTHVLYQHSLAFVAFPALPRPLQCRQLIVAHTRVTGPVGCSMALIVFGIGRSQSHGMRPSWLSSDFSSLDLNVLPRLVPPILRRASWL